MKGVQCYELFGGIPLKNHAFFVKAFFNANGLSSNHGQTNMLCP